MQITLDTERMDARQAASVITLIMSLWPDAADAMTATMYALKPAATPRLSEAAEAARENGYGPSERLTLAPTAADAFAPPAHEPPEPTAAEAFPFVPAAAGPATSTVTETSAPAVAPQPASSAVTLPPGVEVDSAGLPWDGRIHSAGKAKSKDGTWRLKRDVPDETRQAVTAELRAAMGAPPAPLASAAPSALPANPTSASATPAPTASPAPAVSTPPTVSPPSAASPEHAPSPPASAPAAAAPPPPSAPAAPAPAAAPAPSAQAETASPAPAAPVATSPAAEFARVMRKVTEAQTAGRATHDGHTAPALAAAGLTQMRDLLTRPDLLPVFEETFDALLTAS